MKKLVLFISLSTFTTSCIQMGNALSDLSNLLALVEAGTASAHVVAVGVGGKAYYSNDGITWTQATVTSTAGIDLYGVTFSGTQWVAVGGNTASGSCNIYTSAKGDVWTAGTVPFTCAGASARLYDVMSCKGRVVLVGDTGTTGRAAFSLDGGNTWSAGSTATGNSWYRIACDGSTFMVGQTSEVTYVSSDGSTFTAIANTPEPSAKGFTGDIASFSTGRFVWVGQNGFLPNASGDLTLNNGSTPWQSNSPAPMNAGTGEKANAVASNGSRLVTVGDTCRVDISTSTTTPSWSGVLTSVTGCSATNWLGLAWDGSKFIAVGQSGRIAYSPTGNSTDWAIKTIGTANINAVYSR